MERKKGIRTRGWNGLGAAILKLSSWKLQAWEGEGPWMWMAHVAGGSIASSLGLEFTVQSCTGPLWEQRTGQPEAKTPGAYLLPRSHQSFAHWSSYTGTQWFPGLSRMTDLIHPPVDPAILLFRVRRRNIGSTLRGMYSWAWFPPRVESDSS